MFDTVLTAPNSASTSAGIAWVYPLPDGSWSYNIQVPSEHRPVTLKMETDRHPIEELPFPLSSNMTREVVGGISPTDFQLLYSDSIYLNVVTESGLQLKGRLMWRPFGDALKSDAPLMLESHPRVRRRIFLYWGTERDCF